MHAFIYLRKAVEHVTVANPLDKFSRRQCKLLIVSVPTVIIILFTGPETRP